MRLYIIGNGFELAHNLKTSYMDFKKYIEQKYNEFYKELIDIYDDSRLWSDFERTLGEPKVDVVDKINNSFGNNYSWEAFANEIKEKIGKWICSINTTHTKRSLIVGKMIYIFHLTTQIL